jgi:hypothetical protein
LKHADIPITHNPNVTGTNVSERYTLREPFLMGLTALTSPKYNMYKVILKKKSQLGIGLETTKLRN